MTVRVMAMRVVALAVWASEAARAVRVSVIVAREVAATTAKAARPKM